MVLLYSQVSNSCFLAESNGGILTMESNGVEIQWHPNMPNHSSSLLT